MRRATDHVIAGLEARISSGELAHGERLPSERALMAEFGASRSVIREAIAALSNRGLVLCRPRHRPVVRRPGCEAVLEVTGPAVRQLLGTPEGVESLFRTRIFVERALAREAAANARREDIAALRQALEANRAAVEDTPQFYVTDRAFHRVLYEIPRNPVFPAVHEGFFNWLRPHWVKMNQTVAINRVNLAAHEAIYEAILARDPDAAEAAMNRHLEAAWGFVRETFAEAG
jgi:DNA-binding FadR family transcriptional regulator